MAFSIGDISFGINANSKGLRQAMASIDKFKAKTKELARTQSVGAQRQIASMKKTSSALRKAAIDTANLNKTMKKAGAAPARFAETSNALSRLNATLTKSKTSSLQARNANVKFNESLRKTRAAVSNIGLDKGTNKTKKYSEAMKNLESASVLAIGPLSGLGARVRSLSAIFTRGGIQMALFVGVLTALSFGLFSIIKSSIKSGIEFEKTMKRFRAASDTAGEAASNFLFVVDISKKMGQRIQDNARSFSRMTAAAQGTSLAGQGVRDVFKGLATASAALGLSVSETEGIFLAVEQIMSKGTTQAEELRNQLGERLPGAFNRAARAMGVTTEQLNDMLKSGTVFAEEFLPKFAKILEEDFGRAAAENVKTFSGSWNLLQNSIFLFGLEVDNVTGFSSLLASSFRGLATLVDLLRLSFVSLSGIGAGLGEIMFELARGNLVNVFQIMRKNINAAVGAMDKLSASAGDFAPETGEAFQRVSEMIKKTNQEILIMRKRVMAIMEGPASLATFDQVTTQVEDLRFALQKANADAATMADVLGRFESALIAIKNAQEQLHDAAQQSADALVNGFEDAIFSAKKFKDVLKEVLLELIKVAFRAAIFDPISRSLGKTLGGFSFPTLGSAAGGPVQANVPRFVGEKGVEIFTPSTNGSITSNANIGGGSGISITINAPGADQGTIARIRDMITEELAPQLIRAASQHTLSGVRRPKWA